VLALAGLILALTNALPAAADDPHAPIIGDAAPLIAAQMLDGATPIDRLPAGEIVVVDFFATWCGPCHEAMAALDDIVKRSGVRLIVVDVGEPDERVRAWFAEHPLPAGATLVLDPRAEAAHRWGQRRFPTTFVLHDGVIRHINRGFGPGYARRMDGWIAKDLAP